jgi:hypothetical protein
MNSDPDNAAVTEAVLAWQAADSSNDEWAMSHYRSIVLEMMFDAVKDFAWTSFRDSGRDREDIEAAGVEVMVTRIENYLRGFDPTKGKLVQYMFTGGGAWKTETRRRLTDPTTGLTATDQKVVNLYYGFRSTYYSQHGVYPSIEAAADELENQQIDRQYERIVAKLGDPADKADAAEYRARAARRVQQDGELASLGRLGELIESERASRLVSVDALAAATDSDGWSMLETQTPAADDEFDDVPDWVRLATIGMDGRARRRAVRCLTDTALADSSIEDAEVLKVAQRNMADPVAQFLVLAGVESQVEVLERGSTVRGSERELLLAAASL